CMEQDHYDAEAVIRYLKHFTDNHQEVDTPEEIGKALFVACNTEGKNKLAPPTGTVIYHKRGPFIELEITDIRDLHMLNGGTQEGSAGGFYDSNRNFYIRWRGLPKHVGNARLVVYLSGSRGTLEHEEGHYVHRLGERARDIVYGTELKRKDIVEKRLKDLERLYSFPWNISKRKELAGLYQDALNDLQAVCYDRAMGEFVASFNAGDYQYTNYLYLASHYRTDSSYNMYDDVFGKRWKKIPAPLKSAVEIKREEYNSIVLDQGSALNVLATNLRMMGLEPEYRGKIGAFLLDCPLTEIRAGIIRVFGTEFNVAKTYADLQNSIEISHSVVKNVGADIALMKPAAERIDYLVDRFIQIIEDKVARPVREGNDLFKVFTLAQPELEAIEAEAKRLRNQARVIRLDDTINK
ncbi:MAG: hypothetical protein V1905_02680, partial [bacterium]